MDGQVLPLTYVQFYHIPANSLHAGDAPNIPGVYCME